MSMITIDDIVKRLRDRAEGRRKSCKLLQIDDRMFDLLADDIETAIKREREAVGNAAKMREALEDSQRLLENFAWGDNGAQVREQMRDNKEALSAPPRNCDVVTPEEQAERFRRFCGRHKPEVNEFSKQGELLCPSTGCELIACNYGQCALSWANMPYEKGEAK
jgi:hypothetical protein